MAGRQPLEELRKRMLSQAAQTRLPQQDQAQAARDALTGGSGASPGSIQALQRSVGNRATTSVVRRNAQQTTPTPTQPPPQQTEETDWESGREKTVGMVDTAMGQTSNWSAWGGLAKGTDGSYLYQGNNNTQTGTNAGTVGAFGGTATGLYGVVTKSMGAVESQKTKGEEEKAGRTGQAKWRDAKRGHGGGSLDAIGSAGNTVSSTITGLSGAGTMMQNAGASATAGFSGASNLLGGIGGVIALPFQLMSVIRTGRKMVKQWKRVNALAKGWNDQNRSDKKIVADFEKLNELVTAQQQMVTDAEADLAEKKAQLLKAQQKQKTAKGISSDDVLAEEGLKKQVTDTEALIVELKAKLDTLRNDVTAAQTAKTEAAKRIADRQKRTEDEKEDPDDIRAYALRKNQDGRFKKIINIVGGLLGIGGGTAAFVASFAAAGVISAGIAATATPVGWALCGAAALIGLAMGGYALVKWGKKRYETLRKQNPTMSKGKAFLGAINPFKKVGGGERERMASRLYKYATDQIPNQQPGEKKKAEETLLSLGLDPAELKFDQNKNDADQEKAAIKLIMEKMAS